MKPNHTLTFKNFIKQEAGESWDVINQNATAEIRQYWFSVYEEECKVREITPIWEELS